MTAEQVYATRSYQSGNLAGIRFDGYYDAYDFYPDNLSGWDFSEKTLTDASFQGAVLENVDFSGANLARADFSADDLNGDWPNLDGADLSLADLRGTAIIEAQLSFVGAKDGTILYDGHVQGLQLDAAQRLKIWDSNRTVVYIEIENPFLGTSVVDEIVYEVVPITVKDVFTLGPDARLTMLFEDDDWGSTISFEPGIDVSLDGILELTFHWDAEPLELVGATFDLFDWEGANVTGEFVEIVSLPGTQWDFSNLYTTGEVTLVGYTPVPEPSTALMLLAGGLCLLLIRRRASR